jgi:hypothetical protein
MRVCKNKNYSPGFIVFGCLKSNIMITVLQVFDLQQFCDSEKSPTAA